MTVLHVDLELKPGAAPALEKTYREVFRPAISAQEGFADVALLRPRSEGEDYRLVIVFQSEPLRQEWVASDLHQKVWPQMQSHCARYSVRLYEPT